MNQNREQDKLLREIGKKQGRKERARREKDRSILFGMGMFGIVGWSVAIPTLACLAIGIWIDGTYETRFSWTLMMLAIGIILGCMNAWYWVSKESGGR